MIDEVGKFHAGCKNGVIRGLLFSLLPFFFVVRAFPNANLETINMMCSLLPSQADRDHDGQINFDEFFRVMKKRSSNPLDDWSSDED